MNLFKSVVLNINLDEPTLKSLRHNFFIILAKLEQTSDLNFAPLLATIKLDLLKWDRRDFLGIGQINISKINVLTHLLYLF